MVGKEQTTKSKDKNFSLETLSKRAFAVAMSVAVLGSSATILTGCGGDDGINGKSAYELAVENGYTGTLEEWLESLKGADGTNGANGQDAYAGYDGYIWYGNKKTDYKLVETTLDEDVVESTVDVAGVMSNYFAHSYVDLYSSTIALMANYKPTAKLTQYSGTTVLVIKVVANNAGKLHIGTAKVADIVNARINGGAYTASTVEYDVQAGVNTINVNIEVAEDETIVLGGNGSVGLFMVSGIPVQDEYGNYALVDGASHTELISKTGDYQDTLAIQIKATTESLVQEAVFPEILTHYPESKISDMTVVNDSSAPFKYVNNEKLSGKTVKRIGMAVKTLDSGASSHYMTIYKIKTSTTSNFNTNYIGDPIKLTLPSGSEAGKWVYVDCNIELADDETLAFGAPSGDTVQWGYQSGTTYSEYAFTSKSGGSGNAQLLFDIYVEDTALSAFDNHLEKLEEKEQEAIADLQRVALANALRNAGITNFSILGDSISTYTGYSSGSAIASETNSTITNNAVYYTGSNCGITDVNYTWWKQLANYTETNVLVNNSWSGDKVSSKGLTRCEQLHDDTGTNAGTNPDLIAVYLGINDYDGGLTAGTYEAIDWDTLIVDNQDGTFTYGTASTFAEYYAVMIHKLTYKYNQKFYLASSDVTDSTTKADIYLFTHVPNGSNSRDIADLEAYNDIITKIASRFGCSIVDLYNDSGITNSNKAQYMGDSGALHPNQEGMDLITNCFIEVLESKYLND